MMDAVRMVLAVNSPLDCKHNPIELDESPNTAAPSLVVCSLCGEVLDAEGFDGRSRLNGTERPEAVKDCGDHRKALAVLN